MTHSHLLTYLTHDPLTHRLLGCLYVVALCMLVVIFVVLRRPIGLGLVVVYYYYADAPLRAISTASSEVTSTRITPIPGLAGL